jgi:hypothetical protein
MSGHRPVSMPSWFEAPYFSLRKYIRLSLSFTYSLLVLAKRLFASFDLVGLPPGKKDDSKATILDEFGCPLSSTEWRLVLLSGFIKALDPFEPIVFMESLGIVGLLRP